MPPTRGKKGISLLKHLRLVIDSTLPDEELELKVEAVEKELQAIDQALADEGTYLGIVDKGELDKRKQLLERRISLLKQERDLLHELNVALREEEEVLAAAAAEPTELLVSSPEPHDNNKTAAETAEHSSSSSVGTPAAAVPPSQPTVHPNLFSFSLPAAAELGIDDFLMKNAAVGNLAGGAPGATSNVASTQLLGRDTHSRGNRRSFDSDVDEDLT